MKLMQAYLGVKNVRESTFHHCGGPVKLVQGCLSARKDPESSFHHSGGLVKLVYACLRWRVSYHTSAIIVSGLRPPLYSWFFFLNEANHCSSCFSSLISKSYLAVQPYYKQHHPIDGGSIDLACSMGRVPNQD